MSLLILPNLIDFNDYRDFDLYTNYVYEIFHTDFVVNKPIFRGVRLGLKKYPLFQEKEYTFYHFTHAGDIENERIPDMRRMERIGYPKPIIDNSENSDVKVWRNKRNNKERILILHERENYLVVLEDRGSFILPWTCYYIEYNNRKKKLIKEYDDYIKAKTASK